MLPLSLSLHCDLGTLYFDFILADANITYCSSGSTTITLLWRSTGLLALRWPRIGDEASLKFPPRWAAAVESVPSRVLALLCQFFWHMFKVMIW